MSIDCPCCAWPTPENRLFTCRVGEIANDGQVVFLIRRVCARCISAHAIVYPDRLIREMVEDTIERMHQAAVKTLTEEVEGYAATPIEASQPPRAAIEDADG